MKKQKKETEKQKIRRAVNKEKRRDGMKFETMTVNFVHLKVVKEKSVDYGNRAIDSPQKATETVREVIHDMIGDMDRECMAVCATDTRLKPTGIQIVGMGTVNSCMFSVPGIFKAALLTNAANILLFHNHPSGDVTPSREDIECTEKVKKAGELLDVPLLDHIIIGADGDYYSFRENEAGRVSDGNMENLETK